MTQTVASSPYVLNEREPFAVRNATWLGLALVVALVGAGVLIIAYLMAKLFHTADLAFWYSACMASIFLIMTLGWQVISIQPEKREFQKRQFQYWINACPVSLETDIPEGFDKERAFVDWILACPTIGGQSYDLFPASAATKIAHSAQRFIIASSDQGAKWFDSTAARSILSAVVFLEGRLPEGRAESICRSILETLEKWVVSDPKNWHWGRNVRTLLEESVFTKFSDVKDRFPNLDGSIFPPKDSKEFASAISIVASFFGQEFGDISETLATKMFSALLRTGFCLSGDFETSVRIKRFFLFSQEFWDDEEFEGVLESCLCGHFGTEIAEFAVPFVSNLWYENYEEGGIPDEEYRKSLAYRLVHSNLAIWVDSSAIPGIRLLLSDMCHPNVFEDDHPAGMPVEMRLEEDELSNPRN